MEKKKHCDGDCDNCDLPEKVLETLTETITGEGPLLQISQATDDVASIFLRGNHKTIVNLIFNSINVLNI